MPKRALTCRRGIGLWEIALGCVAALVLLGFVTWAWAGVVNQARVARTYQEMSAILDAGRQYEAFHGVWPTWVQVLQVMPNAPGANVWGKGYVLKVDGQRLWVETSLPQGGGGWGKMRMSTLKEYGRSARLIYEQRRAHAP